MGPFNYFTLKQIPNFLLAAPILSISFYAIYFYAKHDWKRMLTLGLLSNEKKKTNNHNNGAFTTSMHFYLKDENLVFIFHWLFLTLFAFIYMHVQVSTRFLCSQVIPLYWFCIHIIDHFPETLGNQ